MDLSTILWVYGVSAFIVLATVALGRDDGDKPAMTLFAFIPELNTIAAVACILIAVFRPR